MKMMKKPKLEPLDDSLYQRFKAMQAEEKAIPEHTEH